MSVSTLSIVLPVFGSAGDLTVPSQDGVTFNPVRDLPLAKPRQVAVICEAADAEWLELMKSGGGASAAIRPSVIIRALAGVDTPAKRKGFAIEGDGTVLIQNGYIKFGPVWGKYKYCTDQLLVVLRKLQISFAAVKFNPQTYIPNWNGPFMLGFPEIEDTQERFKKCFYACKGSRAKKVVFRAEGGQR
jgi:hypothetical protein